MDRSNMKKNIDRFFAPAIYLVNRLKYLHKFLLISAFFSIPIAVSMYLLIQNNIHYWEDFTQKEVHGVQYVDFLRHLLEDAQTHRGLSMLYLAGERAPVARRLSEKGSDIDDGMNRFDPLAGTLEEGSKKQWKAVRESWRAVKQAGPLTASETYRAHNVVADNLTLMIEMTAYDNKLILDPDPDSYFLVNLMIRELPRTTDHVGRLRALGSYALGKSPGVDNEELMYGIGAAKSRLESLEGELAIAETLPEFKADAALAVIKSDLGLIKSRSEEYLKLVDGIVHEKNHGITPLVFFDASTSEILLPVYKSYDASKGELLRLLAARMKSLERQSFFAWSATITVLAAVLYLLAGFYLSVIRTVSRLGVSTRQMSRTGLPEIITLESRDELNEVVMRFNEVAVALRRSHLILLLSERLAKVGSWDLDMATGSMHCSPEVYSIYQADPVNAPNPSLLLLLRGVHPDDAQMVKDRIQKGASAGNIPLFEYRLRLQDGSIRYLSCEGTSATYAPGGTASMTGFVQDITNRKKTEEELREALKKVKQLSGLLPICASCKKIRDDEGYWEAIEMYIERHSEAEFSHSLCDDCVKKLYPDFYDKNHNNKDRK